MTRQKVSTSQTIQLKYFLLIILRKQPKLSEYSIVGHPVVVRPDPHTSVHDCVGYLAGSLHDPLRWDWNLHFVSDVGAALLQDQQEQGRPHQRMEWPSAVIISCKYFSSTALCTSVEICINK